VFRVAQGFVSVTSHLVLLAGAVTGQLWVLAVGQFVVGVSNAAGNLAWNLGHNDFAPPEKAASYMAVHVMLTGLRGFIAPFAGVVLYNLPFVGNWLFAVTGLMCFAALCGFYQMARTAPARVSEERVKQMTQATGG
jgi:MFS family permease